MSKSILAEPEFRQVAGALESMSSRAMQQIQTLTTAINTEDPASGRGAGSVVAISDDLIQLLATPFFPPMSQRWLLIFLLLEPNKTRL